MIYDPATAHFLKPWLVRTLEPVCDAEPGALADYILALLKHNVSEPEMRKELLIQLDEFLEKECPPFVDTLFTVLRTKSYLPYTSEPPPPRAVDSGIPIPLDLITPSPSESNMERGRKRSLEADDREGRASAKGARLSSGEDFSRYGNGSGRSSGHWDGRGEGRGDYSNGRMDAYHVPMMGGMGHMNGVRRPHSYHPPEQKRGICRDYYNNGYCARGVMCKYSHGDDAMVPGQLYMPPGLPFMFPGAMPFGPGVGYDPNDSRMDMRPRHQRAPMLPRSQQEEGNMVHASGELPVIQDLTPSIPKDSAEGSSQTQDTQQTQETEGTADASSQPSQPQMDISQSFPAPYVSMQPHADTGMGSTHRGGYRGRGRGRGTFGGEVHSFRPERRGDKTLVVEKIPEDKLSLENVNDWFKRFGSVTNVAIDRSGGKALVSFSTHEEAYAAWKSEDAVFNNRFVKVFWHRPMQGQGQVGARMLAASAPVVAGIATKTEGAVNAGAASSTASVRSRKSSATPGSSAASALAAKQKLLEQQIAEQKSLMASLETASSEEKKDIMARLRKLGEEMKTSMSTTTTSQTAPGTDHQQKERDRLDKELDLHGTSTPPTSESGPIEKPKKETSEELKARLEKLKAEAASLGLSTEGSSNDWHTGPPSYRGGYRGRARGGRGFFRGAPRGGSAPRFNMTLDNRPKKLLLKGVKDEHLQAVRDWYETTGQLDSVDVQEGEGVIVTFKTRSAAEQGFAKGSNIPIVGQVQIAWFAGKTAPAGSNSNPTKPAGISPTEGHTSTVYDEGSVHTPEAEEETVARGWGGDDDGDGMGML